MMIWKVGQLEKPLVVYIEQLSREPYSTILCYPRASKDEVKKRLRQLAKMKLTAFEFVGDKQILNLQILGKGCVGLVVLARRNGEHVALKIRRIDADRLGMQREAKLLSMANSVEIGPRLLGVSKDFLVMDFETASMDRRSSNVTSVCQFLFLGSEVAKIIAKKIGVIDKNGIVEALRRYKKEGNRERFELVLSACRL